MNFLKSHHTQRIRPKWQKAAVRTENAERAQVGIVKRWKLATCPKNTPAAKRLGEPEVIVEMTFKVIVCPAIQDVISLPGGWVNCAVAVKSFAVQPRFLPARVPIHCWSVRAFTVAV